MTNLERFITAYYQEKLNDYVDVEMLDKGFIGISSCHATIVLPIEYLLEEICYNFKEEIYEDYATSMANIRGIV